MNDPTDPGPADSLDEFVRQLRALKAWAGNPSITHLTKSIALAWRRAGRPASELPARATVGYCFQTGRTRPNPDLLLAIVAVLVADDPAVVERWRHNLQVVLGEAEAANHVSAADRLPADLPEFTGRADVVAAVSSVFDARDGAEQPVLISALGGMAGIGKTALAVHLGHHLLASGAADRALFANLRGFDPDRPPAAPAAVLGSFLRLLGVSGDRVPHTLDKRALLYRRMLATTRTLVVLDNAADAAQVGPLLPGGPACRVLVTSRAALPGLPGSHHLQLPVFTPAEALELLRRAAGPARIDADVDAAARIADLLGHLPLALAVIGGHLRDHPDWALTDYPPALTALALEGGVRAAVALSDACLPPEPRRLLRLLALHPGPDLDPHAAAALAGHGPGETTEQLRTLVAANLLRHDATGRYSFHDLIAAYAAERATLDHPRTHLGQALDRLYGHYAEATATAVDSAYPYAATPRPGGQASPPDRPAALAWLDREHANLLSVAHHAAAHGRPDHTIRQSLALHRHLRVRGAYDAARVLHRAAADLARAAGDRVSEAAALNGLGQAHHTRGEQEQAAECHTRALSLARDSRDPGGEIAALNSLGWVHFSEGRYEAAVDHHTRALELARGSRDRNGEVAALSGLGNSHYARGEYGPATDRHTEQQKLARAAGDTVSELDALTCLGDIHAQQGRFRQAVGCFAQARELARTAGNPTGELSALSGLGWTHHLQGQHGEAARAHRAALALSRATGNPVGEYDALNGLGRAHLGEGRYAPAVDCLTQALELARGTNRVTGQLAALNGLGRAHRLQGRYAAARQGYHQMLEIAQAGGERNWQYEARYGLGRVDHATGQPRQALAEYQQALRLAGELDQPADRARAHDGLAQAYQALGEGELAGHHWRQALAILTDLGTGTAVDVSAADIRAALADLDASGS